MTEPPVELTGPGIVTATSRVHARAPVVFAILRDPQRHPSIDGTGMLRGSEDAPIQGVGDTFVMRMHNDEFGDYEMRNHVTEFVEDHAIEWAPKRHDVEEEDWDHRWGWWLEPDGDVTVVTAYFDCSRSPEDAKRILRNGTRWQPDMEASLGHLAVQVKG
jgi:hypothetical protein